MINDDDGDGDDHMILQLPINKNNINNITNIEITPSDPIPYDDKECYFYSDKNLEIPFNNIILNKQYNKIDYDNTLNNINKNENNSCCFGVFIKLNTCLMVCQYHMIFIQILILVMVLFVH